MRSCLLYILGISYICISSGHAEPHQCLQLEQRRRSIAKTLNAFGAMQRTDICTFHETSKLQGYMLTEDGLWAGEVYGPFVDGETLKVGWVPGAFCGAADQDTETVYSTYFHHRHPFVRMEERFMKRYPKATDIERMAIHQLLASMWGQESQFVRESVVRATQETPKVAEPIAKLLKAYDTFKEAVAAFHTETGTTQFSDDFQAQRFLSQTLYNLLGIPRVVTLVNNIID